VALKKRPRVPNQLAKLIVDIASGAVEPAGGHRNLPLTREVALAGKRTVYEFRQDVMGKL